MARPVSAKSWGGNQFGELGDYTHLNSTNPVHAVGVTGGIAIASGWNHSLAVDRTGVLWAWGDNQYGQLGDGNQTPTNVPVPIMGQTNPVIAIAAGYRASVAVTADGAVWNWGTIQYNPCEGTQLMTTPVEVSGLTNAVSVAAGVESFLALTGGGSVWAWGLGNFGELGDGGFCGGSATPVQVPGLSNIVAVCCGDYHCLALDTNGQVWAWGLNNYGQLGDNETESELALPVLVFSNATQIAAGSVHSLALDLHGNLWAWGGNGVGQLGDGGSANQVAPTQILTVSNLVAVAAGGDGSLAADTAGTVWQWGVSDSDGTNWLWNGPEGFPQPASLYGDYYGGDLPGLQVLGGNHQFGDGGSEFSQPLVFQVRATNGLALSNAPVTVEIVSGDMELRTVSGGANLKGLRAQTDANGQVALIGYGDTAMVKTNCFIRVLAASGAQLAEVDFNETLVPAPTINITSPQFGVTYLVQSNQPVVITVDAEAASVEAIKEVDYEFGTNGVANVPLGVASVAPFTFTWTNALWYTNAFVGEYTVVATAVDDGGGQSAPSGVWFTVALDSMGSGLPDYWQLDYFGQVGLDPNSSPDGNGLSLLWDYQNELDPTDYYCGKLPTLTILGGNDQCGHYQSFLPQPVTVCATRIGNSTVSEMTNAPIAFSVASGSALLAATTNAPPTNSLTLRSDTNGNVCVWVYFPAAVAGPADSTILASASSGGNTVSSVINEFVPLAHWTFNDTNTWVGEAGQMPLEATNVVGIPDWSSNAVLVQAASPAMLAYNVMEADGNTNLDCQNGSILFWFRPDWSSADLGGTGPGTVGRLIDIGSPNPAEAGAWWSLHFSASGTALRFETASNGVTMSSLIGTSSWYAGEWYQIALTYSPTNSALYVDGQLLASAGGRLYVPDAATLAKGFRIGSDVDGDNQVGGAFDELITFDYPLGATNIFTHGSDVPDWWEIEYFNQLGLNPNYIPGSGGRTILNDYQKGFDPDLNSFSISTPNLYVNTNVVALNVSVTGWTPSYVAVLVQTTNSWVYPTYTPNMALSLIQAGWQPYSSNVVASLNSGDGTYAVWVGVKGPHADLITNCQAVYVVLDTIPPIITITNFTSGVVAQPIVQLQGFANERLSSLSYDISNATGIQTNLLGYLTGACFDTNSLALTSNYFQCYDIPLTTNGMTMVTLHARDLAGNTSVTNLSLTLDYSSNTNPPVVSVDWPSDGAIIAGSNCIIQGTVSDPTAAVTVTATDENGKTTTARARVARSGQFVSEKVALGAGLNAVTVTATSAGGNIGKASLSVDPPDLQVSLNPLTSDQMNQTPVNVTGTLLGGDALTVNGVSATVGNNGQWEADNVPVSPYGQATFNVDVFKGNAQVGQQVFLQTEPVATVLMSQRSHSEMYVICPWLGPWGEIPPGCYTWSSGSGTTEWDCVGGGEHYGYGFGSGYWNVLISSDNWPAPGYQAVCDVLPPGYGPNCNHGLNFYDGNQYEYDRLLMMTPSTQDSAGSEATYVVQAQLWQTDDFTPTTNQILSAAATIAGQPVTITTDPDGSQWDTVVMTVASGANVDVTPELSGNYAYNVRVTPLNLQLVVDNNRDGVLDVGVDDTSDQTTPTNPYRFWIDDSHEQGDVISSAEDQCPGLVFNGSFKNAPNYAYTNLQGRSDLVNLFPVAICLSNALQLLPITNGYEYRLSQSDGALKYVYTLLTPTNAFDYLTNAADPNYYVFIGPTEDSEVEDVDDSIKLTSLNQASMFKITPGVVILNTNWLLQVETNGGIGIILVQGCCETKNPLKLEVWKTEASGNKQFLASAPLGVQISGVEDMYRHENLRDGRNAPTGLSGDLAVRDQDPSMATRMYEPKNFPDSSSNGRWFIFMPGSNVGGSPSRGWESEVFKRLYWSENKSKFVGVSWYGDPHTNEESIYDYHMAVRNAFTTAAALASFVNNLSGAKTIAGHSLSCCVIASAIADQGMQVDNACLMDAAFAQECFDNGRDDNFTAMMPSSWTGYPNTLFAAHWHELFDASDARSKLTWRKRFASAASKVFSFYSSTEDCLAEYDGDVPTTTAGALRVCLANSVGFSSYVWVYQEKAKGNRQDYSPILGLSFINHFHVGSKYGGWGFNGCDGYLPSYPIWYKITTGGLRVMKTPADIGPVTPGLLSGSRYNPLFKNGWGTYNGNDPSEVYVNTDSAYFTGPSWILGLYNPIFGDAIAADTVNRNQLLAETIPALSLPVGANSCNELSPARQYDMAAMFADKTHWPKSRSYNKNMIPNWHHSDMDQVAYPYLYKLYIKLVSVANQ